MPPQDELNAAISDYRARVAAEDASLSPETRAARQAEADAAAAEEAAEKNRLATVPGRVAAVNRVMERIVGALGAATSADGLPGFTLTTTTATASGNGYVTAATILVGLKHNPRGATAWLTFQVSEDKVTARANNTAAETAADPSAMLGVNLSNVPIGESTEIWTRNMFGTFLRRLPPMI